MDVLGLPLKMIVHDASIQDRDGFVILLKNIKKLYPSLKLIWVDGGYRGPIVAEAAKAVGIRIQVVKRNDKCFKILPRRWVVERSFAWFEPSRRLCKDQERTTRSQECWMAIRMVRILTKRFT